MSMLNQNIVKNCEALISRSQWCCAYSMAFSRHARHHGCSGI